MPLTFGTKLIAFFPAPRGQRSELCQISFSSLLFLWVHEVTEGKWAFACVWLHNFNLILKPTKSALFVAAANLTPNDALTLSAKWLTATAIVKLLPKVSLFFFFYWRKLFHYITVYWNSSTASSPVLSLGTTTTRAGRKMAVSCVPLWNVFVATAHS